MRIRVNRRYYFKWDTETGGSKVTYFGYFYKHRNVQGWDYGEDMKVVPIRYRLKCYSSDGPTKYWSKKDEVFKYYYYDYVVTNDVKFCTIITSKQFNTLKLLYGPLNEKD